MKLSKKSITELGQILDEEYGNKYDHKDLEKLAYSLVGYFDLLQKIVNRRKFGNSPVGVIDSNFKRGLDKGKEMN